MFLILKLTVGERQRGSHGGPQGEERQAGRKNPRADVCAGGAGEAAGRVGASQGKSDAELKHCRDELEKTSENLNKKKKGVAARAAAFNGGGELQNLKVELTKLSAENRRLAKKWRGMEAKYIEVETSAEEIINELTNEAEEANAALGDAFAPSRIKLPHSTVPLFLLFAPS